MCIKKVTAYHYGGKNYDNEIEAVTAALADLGNRIVKDHANSPVKGLIEHREALASLLDLYGLCLQDKPAAANGDEEAPAEAERGPEVKAHITTRQVQDAYADAISANGTMNSMPTARTYIQACGFADINAFLERASLKQHHKLETILGLRDDEE